MKTRAEIEHAKRVVEAYVMRGKLTALQFEALAGIFGALCWVCDLPGGEPLQYLIDGREIETT
jgi:hypothetical protein